jgi:hypothetical protein
MNLGCFEQSDLFIQPVSLEFSQGLVSGSSVLNSALDDGCTLDLSAL